MADLDLDACPQNKGVDNPYSHLINAFNLEDQEYRYYDLSELKDSRISHLPYSIKILLESTIRNCDNFKIHQKDVENVLCWEEKQHENVEIPFKPSRVVLKDFTGVPAVSDLATIRDAIKSRDGDPERINPLCPVHLVIDQSVQLDVARITKAPASGSKSSCQKLDAGGRPVSCDRCSVSGIPVVDKTCPFHELETPGASLLQQTEEREFRRNQERFRFLKWGAHSFHNVAVVPPESGIVHQVILEFLAKMVFEADSLLYPDSLVGTDSHTTMINGLGIVGWVVGGLEAEAVMLGQSLSLLLPQVIGFKLTGEVSELVTSTDIVLAITKTLKKKDISRKFVEFFGPGVSGLSVAERATIANMCPEYGALVSYFPPDAASISYLRQMGHDERKVNIIEAFLKANKLLRSYKNPVEDPVFTEVIELDLSSVEPCCSGPKRPHDKVTISDMGADFKKCLTSNLGFKGFGLSAEDSQKSVPFEYEGTEYILSHGSVIIAAITSSTNASNSSVMLGAGLLARNAVDAGLAVKPYIKTSLSPGSGVVTYYLKESGVIDALEKLGFSVVGYGCMTCVANSSPLSAQVEDLIYKHKLITCGMLSGNRNFEDRVHPVTKANYLASPMLVIAYAIAGTVRIDFETEPLGHNQEGKPVFLHDIWPSREEIHKVERELVVPRMFQEVSSRLEKGNEKWLGLEAPEGALYPWEDASTILQPPPFFEGLSPDIPPVEGIRDAHVLLNLGDGVTTDHISPAGSIARNSPAGRYLGSKGVVPRDYSSYGSRRGNAEVMARAAFTNIKLINKFIGKAAPKTVHLPSGDKLDVYDAAERYRTEGRPVIILAGKDYGTGSARDWAAKGPWMLGVKVIIAESYERVHRSNLVRIGILPLKFTQGQGAKSLGLTGKELFTIDIPSDLKPRQTIEVRAGEKRFEVTACLESDIEVVYFKHGGLLSYVVREMLS